MAGFGNDFYDQIYQIFKKVTGGHYEPTLKDVSGWGTTRPVYLTDAYLEGQIRNWWAMQPWLHGQYNTTYDDGPMNGSTTSTPGGGGEEEGGGIDLESPLVRMFNTPFNAPDMLDLGGPEGLSYIPPAPTFNAPGYQTPAPFEAPTPEEALNDPGYKFRLDQGTDALQNWAAAKGTLNDSGTAKALMDYGQNAASQEYQNVWNRDYNAYQTNVQNQNVLPYQYAYQNALSSFTPQFQAWQTTAAAGQHQNDQNYLNAWNKWLADYNIYRNWQNDAVQNMTTIATA